MVGAVSHETGLAGVAVVGSRMDELTEGLGSRNDVELLALREGEDVPTPREDEGRPKKPHTLSRLSIVLVVMADTMREGDLGTCGGQSDRMNTLGRCHGSERSRYFWN